MLLDFFSVNRKNLLRALERLLNSNSTFLLSVKVCFLVCEFLAEVSVSLLDQFIVGKEFLVLIALLPV